MHHLYFSCYIEFIKVFVNACHHLHAQLEIVYIFICVVNRVVCILQLIGNVVIFNDWHTGRMLLL